MPSQMLLHPTIELSIEIRNLRKLWLMFVKQRLFLLIYFIIHIIFTIINGLYCTFWYYL